MAIKPPVPPSNSAPDMRVAFQQLAQAVVSELRGAGGSAGRGSALGRLGLAPQPNGTRTGTGTPGPAGQPGLMGATGQAGANGTMDDIVVEQGSAIELLTDSDGAIIVDTRGMAFTERTIELFAVTDNASEYVTEG